MIERRISYKAWTKIDFEDPRFKIRINQYVEAKYLKAIIAVNIVLLHRLVHMMLASKYSLYYYIIDSRPKKVHVNSSSLQVETEGPKAPFEANIVLL